jgi:hypothetical protein
MSVYGLKESVDNRIATLVVAADTVEEYGKWYTDLQALEGDERLFEEEILSQVMAHLLEPVYKGFKKPVHVIFHKDEAQRDAFFEQQKLVEQKSNPARDRQADMLHRHKEAVREETESDEDRNRTIEERTGLDKVDPFDRRSEEEVQADQAMKDEMKKQRAAGTVSSDSFADPDAIRAQRKTDRLKDALGGKMSETMAREQLKELIDPTDAKYGELDGMTADELIDILAEHDIEGVEVLPDADYNEIRKGIMGDETPSADGGDLQIREIGVSHNADGSINVETIRATKTGGEVDTELAEARQEDYDRRAEEAKGGKRSFHPDDFEKVLRGDGRGDAVINQEGDKANPAGPGHSRPSLSDHAEAARREHQAAQDALRQQREDNEREEAIRNGSLRPTQEGQEETRTSNTRDVTLTPKMWDEIDALVKGGDYADVSEVIREAIRAYKAR